MANSCSHHVTPLYKSTAASSLSRPRKIPLQSQADQPIQTRHYTIGRRVFKCTLARRYTIHKIHIKNTVTFNHLLWKKHRVSLLILPNPPHPPYLHHDPDELQITVGLQDRREGHIYCLRSQQHAQLSDNQPPSGFQ